jgi:hypothetical protein
MGRERKRTVFRTRLCIAELAANVLEHGSPRSGGGGDAPPFRRRHRGGASGLGRPFRSDCRDGRSACGSIESLPAGGRGLLLLRALCPDLWYCNDGTYNRVTLKHSG